MREADLLGMGEDQKFSFGHVKLEMLIRHLSSDGE